MQNQRMEKAEKLLNDAKALFKNKSYESCVSRCYYCVFHATLALIELFHIPAESRKHRFVLSVFPREFIHRRKFFPRDVHATLRKIYNARLEADYDLKEFSAVATTRLLDKAEKIYHDIFEAYQREKQQRA